jgi:hypothetical protein
MIALPSSQPFGLSLSKACTSAFCASREGKGFDKLSPNGTWASVEPK